MITFKRGYFLKRHLSEGDHAFLKDSNIQRLDQIGGKAQVEFIFTLKAHFSVPKFYKDK